MTPKRLKEIQERVDATTKGPWILGYLWSDRVSDGTLTTFQGSIIPEGKCHHCMMGDSVCQWVGEDEHGLLHFHQDAYSTGEDFWWAHIYSLATGEPITGNYDYDEGGVLSQENAEFIVHAPEDVRDLLAEVQRLQKEVRLLRRVGEARLAVDLRKLEDSND